MRISILLFVIWSLSAQAAYRLYRLKVTHYDARGKVIGVETVDSSLDPIQFENYHAGFRWDRVELVDTWYCPGDTSHEPYCPKPEVKGGDRAPASEPGGRAALPYNLQPVIP